MFKRLAVFIFSMCLWLSMSGCFALLVGGVAAGTGTAVWLSGKLTQEFHYPYEEVITATKKALAALNLDLVKETKEDAVTQIMTNYSDGREVWIDVRKVSEDSTKVEVRVGGVGSNKEAASKILKRIQGYL